MAKSEIGSAFGFVSTIVSRIIGAVKLRQAEEAILGLPEDTIKALVDEFVQKLIDTAEQAKKILKFVRTVPVPAVKKFVASEAFDNNNPAGIKFYLGENFKTNFLGKVEENVPAGELNIHELRRNSLGRSIYIELDLDHEETVLAHFYDVLKNETSGWFLGYIRDTNGNLWAVSAYWFAGFGWYVYAFSVDFPIPWDAGFRVLARKSA